MGCIFFVGYILLLNNCWLISIGYVFYFKNYGRLNILINKVIFKTLYQVLIILFNKHKSICLFVFVIRYNMLLLELFL